MTWIQSRNCKSAPRSGIRRQWLSAGGTLSSFGTPCERYMGHCAYPRCDLDETLTSVWTTFRSHRNSCRRPHLSFVSHCLRNSGCLSSPSSYERLTAKVSMGTSMWSHTEVEVYVPPHLGLVQCPIQRPQGVPKLLRVPPSLSHCLRNHCAERFYNDVFISPFLFPYMKPKGEPIENI